MNTIVDKWTVDAAKYFKEEVLDIMPDIPRDELSEMVGTTRPSISLFMQRFHNLGLIETNRDRFLIIKEKKLADYLTQIA